MLARSSVASVRIRNLAPHVRCAAEPRLTNVRLEHGGVLEQLRRPLPPRPRPLRTRLRAKLTRPTSPNRRDRPSTHRAPFPGDPFTTAKLSREKPGGPFGDRRAGLGPPPSKAGSVRGWLARLLRPRCSVGVGGCQRTAGARRRAVAGTHAGQAKGATTPARLCAGLVPFPAVLRVGPLAG
jgi:hypothetical protein